SWIFTAIARSVAFARHLAADQEHRFFTHFLPTAITLLVLAFGALALTGLYGVLPQELRTAALLLYGFVLLPLGNLVIANRTLRALLCDRRRARHGGGNAKANAGTRSPAPPAPPVRLSAAETMPGAREAALLEAARNGQAERALALLEAGADANAEPEPGARDRRPLLVLAALLPDTRLLRALIARGADVNRARDGLTALLAATRDSYHGRAEAVMTLLANGADPAAADVEGNTALHGAALGADAGVAAMLLDAEAPLDVLNRAGLSPLAVACRAANWPLARFLLERGAKPEPARGEPALLAAAAIADDDATGLRLLLKHKARVDAANALGRTALMHAALEGHLECVRVLLAAGADPARADQHGTTALMEAARAGAAGVIATLAEAKASPEPRDAHGRDALALACQSPRADAATIKALLALGAAPKRAGADGRSALDHAAAAGRWDLVALLDPDTPLPATLAASAAPEPGADTPAHLLDALRFGHWAIVSGFAARVREWSEAERAALYLELATPEHAEARRWLFAHGLAAEARLADGTRLFDALLARLPASAEGAIDLLGAGATPAGAGLLARALAALDGAPEGVAVVQALAERDADLFGADGAGRTPLHLAVAGGLDALVRLLLARGADPNARDRAGRTPLHAALARTDALPLVRALIAAGADPEAAAATGETVLGLALARGDVALERWLRWPLWTLPGRALRAEDLPAAAACGDAEAVDKLLELGFAVDTRDAKGASALIRACGGGHAEAVRRLLDAGADPTLAAQTGATALSACAGARQAALAKTLLARGAPADQRLPGEVTALMIASALGYPDVVETLLDGGADVRAVDARGRTALHAAAQFCFDSRDSLRCRRLLDALLARGAEVDRADAEGLTPLLLLLGAHAKYDVPCDPTHLGALVPVLLDAGARLDHADGRGVSPLHACAIHALLAPARLLLARGADRGAVDGLGRTAADVARLLGYADLAVELGERSVPSARQTLRQPAE
ncbi:MAG TPA: ankyrin repeat domain-containing protein, partial [Mizugakiibacter sp.]